MEITIHRDDDLVTRDANPTWNSVVLAVVAAVKQAANPVIARSQSLNDLPRLVSTAILNEEVGRATPDIIPSIVGRSPTYFGQFPYIGVTKGVRMPERHEMLGFVPYPNIRLENFKDLLARFLGRCGNYLAEYGAGGYFRKIKSRQLKPHTQRLYVGVSSLIDYIIQAAFSPSGMPE